MKNKTLKYIIIIFLTLLILLALQKYFPLISPKNSDYVKRVSGFNSQKVNSVEIKKGDKSITLQKENNVWFLDHRKVNSDNVSELLNGIFTQNPPEEISSNGNSHKDLDLTEDLATKITVDHKLVLYFGKFDYPASYVRFAGDNTVYMLSNIATSRVSAQSSDWLDKTIVNIDPGKIQKLTFQEINNQTVITRKDNKWILDTTGKEINTDKMNTVLSMLSPMNADSIFNESEGAKYPALPNLIFTVVYDQEKETLEFTKGESDYLVSRLSDGEKFIISEPTVSKLISAPNDLSG